MKVYILWHYRPLGPDETDLIGETDDKMCGIFTSSDLAKAGKERLASLEGFRDYPDGFSIVEVTLDELDWETGFVSLESDQ